MSRWMMVTGTKWVLAQNWLFRQMEKVRNDRGQGAVEYLALAAVLVAVLAFVLSQAEDIGRLIVAKIKEFIENIKPNT